jgi:CMP-N-acetylneuraminic acid synthetase
MRHHSQRVPGKNYRELAGKPLYAHILASLEKCPSIAEVVVDTDSRVISEGIQQEFPSVTLVERAAHLREDETSMNEVLSYDTNLVAADFYLQTHSTNPLLKAETIENALALFLNSFPEYDSLFSVTRIQSRLWDQLTRPVNHNPDILLQTQDLPPIYEENSCLYVFSKEILLEKRNRIGHRPLMYEINAAEAWDIDEEIDFDITHFLMKN